MYKVRTCRIRNPVRTPDVRHFLCSLSIPSPSRQCRFRPTLYAVRYAPGERGHAITNWQCISHIQGGLKSKPLPNYQNIVLNRIKACQ